MNNIKIGFKKKDTIKSRKWAVFKIPKLRTQWKSNNKFINTRIITKITRFKPML